MNVESRKHSIRALIGKLASIKNAIIKTEKTLKTEIQTA
jgi:hypothetical protein